MTQRGNRRQRAFFNDGVYVAYLELMDEWCRDEGVEICGCCLMPNHVPLIAVPQTGTARGGGLGLCATGHPLGAARAGELTLRWGETGAKQRAADAMSGPGGARVNSQGREPLGGIRRSPPKTPKG